MSWTRLHHRDRIVEREIVLADERAPVVLQPLPLAHAGAGLQE